MRKDLASNISEISWFLLSAALMLSKATTSADSVTPEPLLPGKVQGVVSSGASGHSIFIDWSICTLVLHVSVQRSYASHFQLIINGEFTPNSPITPCMHKARIRFFHKTCLALRCTLIMFGGYLNSKMTSKSTTCKL